MKILFVHEVDYQHKPIFEIQEFPEALSARGHEIAFLDYTEEHRPDHSGFRTKLFMKPRVVETAKIRAFHQRPIFPGILGRLYAAASSYFAVRKAILSFEPDCVVTYSVPTQGAQAALAARVAGKPVIYRALDVSHLIRKTSFSWLVKFAEVAVCKLVTHISANNAALLNYYLAMAREGVTGTIDYPILDIDFFSPGNTYEASSRDKSIVYMGSFFYFSGLDRMLRHYASVDTGGTTLTLIGKGEQEEELRRLVDDLNLREKVFFRGYVDFHDLPMEFSRHRVAINPMLKSTVSDCAFPNKVIQYMAAELPVVTTRLQGLEETFGAKAPFVWAHSPEDAIEEALKLAMNPEACNEMSKLAKSRLEPKFDRESAIFAFEEMIRSRVRAA